MKVTNFKIGVTKNIENRLRYFKKDYPDFRFIKVYEVNHPYLIESMIIERHYKGDFSCFGSEWYGYLTPSKVERLCSDVSAIISDYQDGEIESFGFNKLKNKLKKGFVYIGTTS